MLFIDYGRPEDCLDNSDLEFDGLFEYNWLDDPFTVKILREVDNAEWYKGMLRDLDRADRLFGISDISGGAKALMILYHIDDYDKVWGPLFGDNCASLLLDIAENKDITVFLGHIINFPAEKFKAFSNRLKREYIDISDYEMDAVYGIVEVMHNDDFAD